MKRLTVLLCALLACLMVTSVSAAEGTCGDYISWTLEDEVLTLSGSGATTHYERNGDTDVVPTPWWDQRDSITTVVVEEGIEKLDNYCFYRCANLTEVQLPESLQRIETRVFAGCRSLKSITFPKNLSYIGYEACVNTGLTEITFEGYAPKASGTPPFSGLTATVYYNGDSNFSATNYGGNLTWEAVTQIVDDGSPDPAEGIDMTNPEYEGSCGSRAKWAFKNGILLISGSGEMDKFTRNEDLDSVNSEWYEWRDRIKEVVVAKGITRVNNYAFYKCENLEKVTLPSTVVAINFGAFKGCTALEEIALPASIIEIGSQAFANSGLKKIEFKGAIPTDIGDLMTDGVTATLTYPCTEDEVSPALIKVFGGTLDWKQAHEYENGVCKICGSAKSSESTEPGNTSVEPETPSNEDEQKTEEPTDEAKGVSLSSLTIMNICLTVVALATIVMCMSMLRKLKKTEQ